MTERARGHFISRSTLPASAVPQMPQSRTRARAASEAGGFVDRSKAAPRPWSLSLRSGTVTPGFERHCVAEFEHLAKTSPLVLLSLANSELRKDDVLLAQAAEAMALSSTATDSIVLFLQALILEHPRPFVREAGINALAPFLKNDAVRAAIETVATTDASPGVREAAAEVLALP